MRLLVRKDDGLCVYASAAAVVLDVEALDAESSLREIYDESGRRYRIEWLDPNRKLSIIGIPLGASNGVYRLVPEETPDLPGLLALLRDPEWPLEHRALVASLIADLG